jgi:hypothetical protein
MVEVEGDLTRPLLEASKHDEFRWIGWENLALLAEGRPPEDRLVLNLVTRALVRLRSAAAAGEADGAGEI